MNAFSRYAMCFQISDSNPYKLFHQDFQAISSSILAILSSLSRPHSLISSLHTTQKALDRHVSSIRRSDRWPLGLLDDTRKNLQAEAQEKTGKSRDELRTIASELSYTQRTVASELASWQDLHARLGRRAIRALAQRMVVKQRDTLDNMKRAMRGVINVK